MSSISNESLAVLQHFGAEAPALLNRYSTTLEDAVVAQAEQTVDVARNLEASLGQLQETRLYLGAALEDNAAYQELTTDIDLLTDYYNELTGPGGVYECLTPQERSEQALAAEVAQYSMEPGDGSFNPQLAAQMQQEVMARRAPYQRPSIEMPEVGNQASAHQSGSWLEEFSRFRRENPSQAYQFLDALNGSPALAAELLISDSAPGGF